MFTKKARFHKVENTVTKAETVWYFLGFPGHLCTVCLKYCPLPTFQSITMQHGPYVSTTSITAMGCQQCLPLSVVWLKGKQCPKPHCCNGVVNMMRNVAIVWNICWRAMRQDVYQKYQRLSSLMIISVGSTLRNLGLTNAKMFTKNCISLNATDC